MQINVIRSVFTDTATLGKMYINSEFFAYTLEDKYRDLNGDCSRKIQDQTCIDQGSYKVVATFSTHFRKELPQLLNVPCFEGIRIHGGNTTADTYGCILIGANSDMKGRVSGCAAKVASITAQIQTATAAGEAVSINVVNRISAGASAIA